MIRLVTSRRLTCARQLSGRMEDEDPFIATDVSVETQQDELSMLLPSKLDHAVFESADFDAQSFLLSRRHVPIEDLRADLKEYLATLRQELVGVINQEYEDFLGLGIGLRGTDKRLERMKDPIAGFQQEIQVCSHVHAL
jgi:hypothetical protein